MIQASPLQLVQSVLSKHSACLMPYRLRQSIQASPSPPAQRPMGTAHLMSPGNVPARQVAPAPGSTLAADMPENSNQPSKTPKLQVGSISTVSCRLMYNPAVKYGLCCLQS